MSAVCTTITIEREPVDGRFVEIEVEARFDYHPACRGQRDSLCGVPGAGPPLEPDEPAMLEFIGATADGKEIELTQQEQDQAEEQAWAELAEAADDADRERD